MRHTMESDKTGCVKLFAMRRTAQANIAMQTVLGTGTHLLSQTQNEATLFRQIRHEYRLMEMFDTAALASRAWPVLYENKDPYESGLMRNVTCHHERLDQKNSVYLRAKLCAPATHALCLLWAVEYMPTWCPNVSSAFLLKEIDHMSRYVMLHLNPGIVSMYRTVVAFVKLSVIELHEGGAVHVGISVENMTDEAIEEYRPTTNKHITAHINHIFICVRPVHGELGFEISVLYTRRPEHRVFAYVHDCVWLNFVMPWVWGLAVMSTKTAMLDRNAVCLESWIAENGEFHEEITRKISRARDQRKPVPEPTPVPAATPMPAAEPVPAPPANVYDFPPLIVF